MTIRRHSGLQSCVSFLQSMWMTSYSQVRPRTTRTFGSSSRHRQFLLESLNDWIDIWDATTSTFRLRAYRAVFLMGVLYTYLFNCDVLQARARSPSTSRFAPTSTSLDILGIRVSPYDGVLQACARFPSTSRLAPTPCGRCVVANSALPVHPFPSSSHSQDYYHHLEFKYL